MKSGAGDDPFADPASDGETDEAAEADEVDADSDAEVDVEVDADVDADSETDAEVDVEVEAEVDADSDADDSDDEPDIPWVLRRRSVKDDRPNVTQFFLRDATDRAERRFRSEVEERLDTDVYMLDLREAAYLVAMEHPDEVADRLEEWGYEYLD